MASVISFAAVVVLHGIGKHLIQCQAEELFVHVSRETLDFRQAEAVQGFRP